MDSAVSRHSHAGRERIRKEGSEGLVSHLAGRHTKLAVPAPGIGVAIDPHIAWWIHKRSVSSFIRSHHSLKKRQVPCVTATDPMLSCNPDVPRSRSRRGRNRRNNFVIGIGGPI